MPATPFWQPLLLLGNPSLTCLEIPLLLTWKSLLCVVVRIPVHLVPGWQYTEPPFSLPLPPFLFQRFPLFKCMPSQDDFTISASHSLIQ